MSTFEPNQPSDQPTPPPAPSYGSPSYGTVPAAGVAQANTGLVNIAGLGTVKIATLGQRFVARLIDGVIVTLVVWIIGFLGLGALAGSSDEAGNPSGFGVGAMVTTFFIIAAFSLLYEMVMIAVRGQTLGKMIMGVKVVLERNGQVPGWGPSFIRWIVPIVGALACYIGALLVLISPLFDSTGKLQGWHDKAANTLVINIK
ncbi:RDD family protein [Pedococcus sp. NPDC057267]|uniref:RDD family protein n=1 Tax=Pedococcus sp. NPDC057267 TaxID=3346077 RepID=UPI003626A027